MTEIERRAEALYWCAASWDSVGKRSFRLMHWLLRLRLPYRPYWRAVERHIREMLAQQGRSLHLAVHSFTPVYDDGVSEQPQLRSFELGIMCHYSDTRPCALKVARIDVADITLV